MSMEIIGSREDYKYVGKNVPRKEAAGIVTGETVFLNDFSLPGMLIGKALKSPYPHAEITRIDISKAEKLPGVHAVITYENIDPSIRIGYPPIKPFLSKRVRYVGDMVALVAAETEDIAKAAMDLIEVEYEQLEAVYDCVEAIKDGAPQLYEELPNNMAPGGYLPYQKPENLFWKLNKGDVEKGFAECEYVVEDVIAFDKKTAPLSPEPAGAVCRYEGNNKYTVWGATQSGYICKIISGMSIPGADFTINTFNIGGSYGNKQGITLVVVASAILAKAANRPVKFYNSKVEQMVAFDTRLGSVLRAKVGMDKDGYIRAIQGDWLIDSGGVANGTQAQAAVGLGEAQLMMSKCENWDFESKIVVTNKTMAGCVRGFGGQELNSCLSLLFARLMKEGNMDPVEFYKKNFVQAGTQYTWRDGIDWTCKSINYVPVMTTLAEKYDWKSKWKGWNIPTWTSEDGKKVRGVGCSIIGNGDVGEDNTEVYVRVSPNMFTDDARIILQANCTESGMGQRSNICKMVAEILNVPYDSVVITPPDENVNPNGFGLCGSRGTITYGRAVTDAAKDIKKQLFELAEPYLLVPQEQMRLENFCVVAETKPGKSISWKHLIPENLTLTGYGKHLETFATPNFFMIFVEVEVDKETGKVDATNVYGGSDCGQVIDPAALELQVQGCFGSASLDTALFEENITDPATGRQMTYDMLEYKWRPFNEFPDLDCCFMNSQFDTFHFKALGVGEITGAAAASATMQAISNAIGVQICEYPATPAAVLRAMGRV